MTSFRFSLQKALDLRRTQLQLAEAQLQQQLVALAGLDSARIALAAVRQRTEVEVRGFQPLAGSDLSALGDFRFLVRSQESDLAAQRVACQKELALRQAAMLEARRRCRLLERLKERRAAEWQSARNRELEELASDSYLAQWNRRNGPVNDAAVSEPLGHLKSRV